LPRLRKPTGSIDLLTSTSQINRLLLTFPLLFILATFVKSVQITIVPDRRIRMSDAARVLERRDVLSDADRLFATVDGASVSTEHGEWHSLVQGIFTDGPFIWLQLQRDDDETRTALLRLPRSISVDALVAALPSIHFGEAATPQILRGAYVG